MDSEQETRPHNFPAAFLAEVMAEFAEGWQAKEVLGEGAYGEVYLLHHRETNDMVAMKMLDSRRSNDADANILKEISVHKALKHPNVIQFLGYRQHAHYHYLFLEYAIGGELFDRIEPDVGMSQGDAQFFFHQLLDGIEYMHSRGIAHRDIKPENLLIGYNDVLKIADFGLATLFRSSNGTERQLDRCCGTLPYVAPEVVSRKLYRAEPADLWSAGVVLVAMLVGELPWERPSLETREFAAWARGEFIHSPWTKLGNRLLSLIRSILAIEPSQRKTISDIRKHSWMLKKFKRHSHGFSGEYYSSPTDAGDFSPVKRSRVNNSSGNNENYMPASQPVVVRGAAGSTGSGSSKSPSKHDFLFSQPANSDDLLLATQQLTQSCISASQKCGVAELAKMVRRMTRFKLAPDRNLAVNRLCTVFTQLGLTYRTSPMTPDQITVETMDRRNVSLVFKVNLLPFSTSPSILADFRLSKGDGLEFKRCFVLIRNAMQSFIISST